MLPKHSGDYLHEFGRYLALTLVAFVAVGAVTPFGVAE
jgi:hypothetical protein